jgi:hypothetical protein
MTSPPPIQSRVQLKAPDAQPEIGTAVGVVHGCGPEWVEVSWPGRWSWHKAGDVVATVDANSRERIHA